MPSEEAEKRHRLAANLEVAINEYVEAQGFQGMLGDWVIVGSMVRIDEDDEADTEYFAALKGGSMLPHVALGLLVKGSDVLVTGDE